MRLLLALAVFTGWMPQTFACNPYMSKNSPFYNPLKFQFRILPTEQGGITRADYDELIGKVLAYYAPIVSAKGGTLEFPDDWDDNQVNGFADQDGNVWKVHALGGYARHPATNRDAFMFLLCHEMGHHIGGTPHYSPQSIPWASAEGQADYFGSLKCMRHMMKNEDNEAWLASTRVPQFLQDSCLAQFSSRFDQLLCMRAAMGGWAMTQVWEEGHGTFKFETPSTAVATETQFWHPENQCRIDTYLQASLCNVPAHVDVDNTDARIGTCNRSSGQTVGARPQCWYAEATN